MVDETQLYSFSHRHCEHCLKRVYNKGKLYICEDIVFSIATELVKNGNEDVPKQDCEHKAFYPAGHLFDNGQLVRLRTGFLLCRENNWRFLVRFKDVAFHLLQQKFWHSTRCNLPTIALRIHKRNILSILL